MIDCRDFHLFTELPPEIRARIWRFAVEPLEKTRDLVADDEIAFAWLKRNTEPL